jgi:hypothetical protein
MAQSDFDRTYVLNFNYYYQLPSFFKGSSWMSRLADGWAIEGTAVFESGQPYSVIDYSGAVGSVFYGTSDGIINPIVPLAPGCTPQNAVTGSVGACGIDPYETNFISSGQRNIFRQAWQKRSDISLVKTMKITERFSVKYTFDVFNLTNTPSFDIPIDTVQQNNLFDGFPTVGQPVLPTTCGPSNTSLYSCPTGLGAVNKTIGGPRQIQMSLSVLF